jgi:glyoxylase-like metal-dependent hydrolase (beta-lactamase superfamily II)
VLKALAEDLYQLGGFPPNAVNIYLMGGVLVDAGTRFDRRRILRQIKGRDVIAHALTHAHPDHQGASHAVCEARGLPLLCSEADAAAAEEPGVMWQRMTEHLVNRAIAPLFAGPGHPVARRLSEGDEVGGFAVVATPGHTIGHISFWRESDRTLVLGDVLANTHFLTGMPGLHEPPLFFSADPSGNRASARKVAAFEPSLVCFGHGPPLRDSRRFMEFVDGLAD